MFELEVYGLASAKKIKTIKLSKEDLESSADKSLMDFLRSHSLPIASSCYGEGVCEKCEVTLCRDSEIQILSCQWRPIKIFSGFKKATIKISYL